MFFYARVLNQKINQGLSIELYNSSDLTTTLANTNIITTRRKVYRFDFHSIDTYTLGFSSVESSTQIVIGGSDVIQEDAIFTSLEVGINGDVVVTGAITASGAITANSAIVNGAITASSAILNGVNINTTLADILSRLDALENP